MTKWRGNKEVPDGSIDKPYTYRPEQFSKRQLERLSAVAVQATIEFQEMNRPALNRLAFARYLIAEGIISEGLAGNGVELVEGYEPDITVGGHSTVENNA